MASTANAYYPQLILLNDPVVDEPGKSQIRFVNLMPGTIAWDLSLSHGEKETLSHSDLAFPEISETHPVSPGDTRIKLMLPGNPDPGIPSKSGCGKGNCIPCSSCRKRTLI